MAFRQMAIRLAGLSAIGYFSAAKSATSRCACARPVEAPPFPASARPLFRYAAFLNHE
jgi:hypothetical protein